MYDLGHPDQAEAILLKAVDLFDDDMDKMDKDHLDAVATSCEILAKAMKDNGNKSDTYKYSEKSVKLRRFMITDEEPPADNTERALYLANIFSELGFYFYERGRFEEALDSLATADNEYRYLIRECSEDVYADRGLCSYTAAKIVYRSKDYEMAKRHLIDAIYDFKADRDSEDYVEVCEEMLAEIEKKMKE